MLVFSAGCLQLHVLEKYLKSIYNSLRGEKKDFWFKFFWEPENRIACLALGCDLSIFFWKLLWKKVTRRICCSCCLPMELFVSNISANIQIKGCLSGAVVGCRNKEMCRERSEIRECCQAPCVSVFALCCSYKTVPSSLSHQVLFHFGGSQECLWSTLGSVSAVGYLLPGLIQHLPRHGIGWNSQTSSGVNRGVFAVLHWENSLDFLHFQWEWYGLGCSESKTSELLGWSFYLLILRLIHCCVLAIGDWGACC